MPKLSVVVHSFLARAEFIYSSYALEFSNEKSNLSSNIILGALQNTALQGDFARVSCLLNEH